MQSRISHLICRKTNCISLLPSEKCWIQFLVFANMKNPTLQLPCPFPHDNSNHLSKLPRKLKKWACSCKGIKQLQWKLKTSQQQSIVRVASMYTVITCLLISPNNSSIQLLISSNCKEILRKSVDAVPLQMMTRMTFLPWHWERSSILHRASCTCFDCAIILYQSLHTKNFQHRLTFLRLRLGGGMIRSLLSQG